MNIEIDYLWSHKCPKKWDQYTLIALVITIVVLIILAAVAINLSLGNNGIFNRAKTAKEQYQNAQDYEKKEIIAVSNQIENYVSSRAGTSTYKIEKLGNATGSTPIPFDVTKYDEIYVEVHQNNYYVFNIKTVTLTDSYKSYISPAVWAGSGMWCEVSISKTNVRINCIRRDNADKMSVSTIEAYGVKY